LAKIGFVTIGQAPRKDITDELIEILPQGIEIAEIGALDDLSIDEIRTRLSPKPGETLYVTRLRDGTEVKISREKILGLMETKIKTLDKKGVDIIAILCSGEFPSFYASIPILYPDKILKGTVSGIRYEGRSAVLIPAEEQIMYAKDKWSPYLGNPDIVAISPYTSKAEDFIVVGKRLKDRGIGLAIMDCMGYTLKHKNIIRQVSSSTKVVTSRGALAGALLGLLK